MDTLRRLRGLSLTEVVIALSVLTLLASIVVPSLVRQEQRVRCAAVVDEFRVLEDALVRYYADTGSFAPLEDVRGLRPAPDSPAQRHFVSGDGAPGWNGPYLTRLPQTSSLGGSFDVDVFATDRVCVDLGTRAQLGRHFEPLLAYLDRAFDGDGDPAAGAVRGDADGLHYWVQAGPSAAPR